MLAPTKPVKSCECGNPCGGCCGCTKESIGLGNVDNTSDLNKPLSRDMVDALNVKVNLDVFTQLKNRVLALENSIPDISALENRMTNAEVNIEMLHRNYENLSTTISSLTATVNTLSGRVTDVNDALVTVGTRVDALETKDSNNVKLSGVNVQTIQGTLKANDPGNGATDKTLVTANWVSQTGDEAPNNLIHKSGNEVISGIKTFEYNNNRMITVMPTSNTGFWVKVAKWNKVSNRYGIIMTITTQYFRDVNFYGKLMFGCWDITNFDHLDLYAYYNWSDRFKLTWDGSEIALWFNNKNGKVSQNLVIFIEAEWAGSSKVKHIIPIDPQNQIAQSEPDWASFTKVLNCDFKGMMI